MHCLAFLPDGRLLAVARGDEGPVQLWDPTTGKLVRALGKLTTGIETLAFSADGKTLAGGSRYGLLKVFDAAAGAVIQYARCREALAVRGVGQSWIGPRLGGRR